MKRRYTALLLGAALGAIVASPATAQTTAPSTVPQPPLAGQAPPPTGVEGNAVAGTPAAQDTQTVVEEQPGGDVIVTGIRRSLAEAVNVKRQATQIVDTIVAEDIGKLPDRTVAESLQRVSGVQVRRGIADASAISIRGLRQNNVLLNGRDIPDATGRGGSGQDSINSGSYGLLARVPSELLARLDVVKSPAADDVEGALGGTVDIITRRPLDGPDQLFAASAQAIYSERADKTGYRISALFSRSFADDTLGVVVNGVYARRRVREDGFESFSGYTPLGCAFNNNPAGIPNRNPACPGTTVPAVTPAGAANFFDGNGDGRPAFYIADFRYQIIEDDRESIGATGMIQWRPTENLEVIVDGLYSRLESDRIRRWFAIGLSGVGNAYTAVTLSPADTLRSGTITGRLQNNFERPLNVGETYSGAINARLTEGPVTVFGEYAYSRATQDFNQFFLRSQTINTVNVGFDVAAGPVPTITLPAGFDPTAAAAFGFSNVFDSQAFTGTGTHAARIDFDLKVSEDGFIRSIEAGGRYVTFNSERITRAQTFGAPNIPVTNYPGSTVIYSTDRFLGSLPNGGLPGAYLLPIGRFAGAQTCQTLNASCAPGTVTPTESYVIREEFLAAYLKTNFAFSLGSMPVTGNIGGRFVTTDLLSSGTLRLAAGLQPANFPSNYEDFLPSASFRAELTPNLILRGAAAKIIARPNTGDLTPALGLNLTNSPPTGSGGNPGLSPFRADQYDLSLEWYYRPGAIISVGLFRKDIESFISTQVFREFIPGDPREFLITRRANGAGGRVQGAEVLFQIPFTFLPGALDGLGVTGTYSYTESRTPFVNGRDGNRPLPLEGLSKHNVNVIGYYERGPFGLRVAYNWRDRFLDSIGAGGAGVFYDNYENLSVTARFDITDNIGIDLEAANLTDADLRRYDGLRPDTRSIANFGRSYSAALRVRF